MRLTHRLANRKSSDFLGFYFWGLNVIGWILRRDWRDITDEQRQLFETMAATLRLPLPR